jgi:hypothetical protein
MDRDQLTEKYLQLAGEAEGRANLAREEFQKKQWRDIAGGYRNLAQTRMIALRLPSTLPASRAKYGR